MTEAEMERLIDARVMRRLSTDPKYINAENAEEQAEAETQIEKEIIAEIQHEAWKRQRLAQAYIGPGTLY